MSDGPVWKRRRTTAACNSCRAKKAKCDGKRPICGRCLGYGYNCTWRNKAQGQDTPVCQFTTSALSTATGPQRSQELLAVYQQLVRSLTPQLPGDVQVEVRNCLAIVQARVESLPTSDVGPSPSSSTDTSSVQPIHSQRYLGEISDVHFCNIIKQTSEQEARDRDDTDGVDDYDREELSTPRHFSHPLLNLPRQTKVEEDLNIYFSTIHVAYPFVSKPSFMEKLETLQTQGVTSGLTPSWLSLLYALLAIGAYYNSFRESPIEDPHSHQRLFQQSLIWSENEMLERSLTQTSALLARCFYFLVTSQYDRCWISLGIAIRLGQSIGLHVNVEDLRRAKTGVQYEYNGSESRGRVWYSLYVLDRLLALQLGRPPAISDEDCHVPIPHPLPDVDLDGQEGGNLSTRNEGDTRRISDYFACTIRFSSVVGRVLRETYHPQRKIQASLSSTESCDKILLEWKDGLPRHLRFDLGHVFENSVIFKRQRNMLAIKFHHIRILIHRPYICYPHLEYHNHQTILPEEHARVRNYGNTCVMEARAIAHLMHNVSDTTEIVQNSPWWQMVSCIVAAASVLVLAENFAKYDLSRDQDLNFGPGLSEDIDTCVHVLQALSDNSNGAKLACSMVKSLRARSARISVDSAVVSSSAVLQDGYPGGSEGEESKGQDSQKSHRYYNDPGDSGSGSVAGQVEDMSLDTNVDDRLSWPMTIPDWMNWSTEFLESFQGPDDSTRAFTVFDVEGG